MKSLALLSLGGLVANINAHPTTHNTRDLDGGSSGGVDLSAFPMPEFASSYINADDIHDHKLAILARGSSSNFVQAASDFVKKSSPGLEFRVMDDHHIGSTGIAYINMKQTIHGIDVDNGDFKVNINTKDGGSIFSFGNGFYSGKIPETNPLTKREGGGATIISPLDALNGAIKVLKLPIQTANAEAVENKNQNEQKKSGGKSYTFKNVKGSAPPKADIRYAITNDQTLKLVWRIETDLGNNWIISFVDAQNPNKIHQAADYVAHVAQNMNVYPWTYNSPDDTGASRQVLSDPWNTQHSPFGWFSDGTTAYNTTRGNNGYAQTNPNDTNDAFGRSNYTAADDLALDTRPTVTDGNYNFDMDLTTAPSTYANASITQLFYTANKYHDVLYTLGFTESAGNFQANNNGNGGKDSDPVSLNAQDGAGVNNANFATPVDGQSPRMRMYVFDTSNPNRDGAFDQGVVVHEYTHGLSNRLTGGAANDNCLSSLESRGMGEGWSDIFAVGIATKTSYNRNTTIPFGGYVNNGKSIRGGVPYTCDVTKNNRNFATMNSNTAVHAVGAVWAEILYEIFWNLIEKYGITEAEFPVVDANGIPGDGRFMALKFFLEGLNLQPCNPTVLQARDAIIDAEKAATNGTNKCEIWKGFAKRGLGTDAKRTNGKAVNGFKIPADCEPKADDE